jgi:hypothetical protein
MTSNNHRNEHDCATLIALIPDYAFGLTSATETRLVEEGLPSCPDAAAQLLEFRQLQEEMRASVPQMEPPAALQARLMSAVRATKTPRRAAPPTRKIHPAWLSAAAVLVLFLISNVYWTLRVSDLQRQNEILSYEHPIDENNDAEVAFVLTTTNTLRWVKLPQAEASAGGNAVLMWNQDSKIGLLYVTNFPKPAAGKIYQLWLTRGEERISAGIFTVDETGVGSLLFRSDDPLDIYTWARITSEPETGSEQPGENTLAGGEL